MKIEKVLSRGHGAEAQVLLVLVSTLGPLPADEDLWVGLGWSEPIALPPGGGAEAVESCRRLSALELDTLDCDRKPGQRPFNLDREVGRCYWLARFDFSDHAYVQGQWARLVQGQDKSEPDTLQVTAWRSRLVRSAAGAGTKDSFEPMPGHVGFALTSSAVVVQPPFELGVLFVHGIGNHRVRETLVQWAEPIVRVWRERGFALEAQAERVPPTDRDLVSRWTFSHQLRARIPIDGIFQVVEEFAPRPPQRPANAAPPVAPLVRPSGGAPVTYCAAAKTEETRFADLAPGMPSSALLRLSTVDAGAVLRESHVLFAEAYWSREAFPPTWSELRQWLTTAIPIAVWARQERLFVTRPAEISRSAHDAIKARDPFEVFRVAVSTVFWALQVLVRPPLHALFAAAFQIVMVVMVLIGVLPIPWLQRGIRGVIAALLGTIGQSHALQNSPIRRAAIVSAVTKDLNWLSDRCHRVVVLAHSQGAEVTRRVFLEAQRAKLARWYTFGAGIAPLNMLHPRSLTKRVVRRVVLANRCMLIALAALLVALALDMTPGVQLGTRAWLAGALRQSNWWALGWAYLMFLGAFALLVRANRPPLMLKMRASVLPRWRDYFASEDPVPGGSFIDRFRNELKEHNPSQRRIFNTRVSILDHTTYWKNVEEFVTPIAMDLLHLLGMGGNYAQEKTALERAARRRDLRTWWNTTVTLPALTVCLASILWTAFGPFHRGSAWAGLVQRAWSQREGLLARLRLLWDSGFFGQIISDLWLPSAIVLVLAGWWGAITWQSHRSEKALIEDLAAAARTPRR